MGPRRSQGGLLEPTFTFARVRGIAIGAHWTWALVAALVVWTLATRLFPTAYPGLTPVTYWAMGSAATVLFFGSVLAHELGHALTAVRRGAEIEGITLWLFGGVARIRGAFSSAQTEMVTALAGPAISLVLVAFFSGLALLGSAIGWAPSVRGVVDYLARINLLVLGFNLVPALPLDGGRVLRAWLWKRTGDPLLATYTAARAGRTFGILLIGIGLLGFFTGADTGGLWIAFIGWFLLQAAQSEAAQASVRRAFEGQRVADLMTAHPEVLAPDVTVAELLDRAAAPGNPSSYPVVDDGALVGFVSFRQAGDVARSRRSRTPVSRVMVPADDVPTLSPDQDVADAVELLQDGSGRAVVVDDAGAVAGVLTLADVARALEIGELRGAPVTEPGRRPAGRLVAAGITLILVFAASMFYRPPFVVFAPGPSFDAGEGVRITGVPSDELNGKYLLATVSLEDPTAFDLFLALFDGDREIVSEASLFPEDVDEDEYLRQQQEVFQESRLLAAAAAADAVGMRVRLRGSGAIVRGTVEGSPAAAALQPGDVIVRVGDRKVRLASDVGDEIRSHPEGTSFRLTFERAGSRRAATVRSTILEDAPDAGVIIGAQLETRDFDIDLPFEIEFPESDVGGPSAGLAYALAIADMLDSGDFARGRTIAATGEINVEGEVGGVGGVEQKAAGVDAAGADVFLVPAGQETGLGREGLVVRAVRTLEGAIRALRSDA